MNDPSNPDEAHKAHENQDSFSEPYITRGKVDVDKLDSKALLQANAM